MNLQSGCFIHLQEFWNQKVKVRVAPSLLYLKIFEGIFASHLLNDEFARASAQERNIYTTVIVRVELEAETTTWSLWIPHATEP